MLKKKKRKPKSRRQEGSRSATDVKKIVSEVQKIGLHGVALWNLNSRCVVPTTPPPNKVARDHLGLLSILGFLKG